MKEKEVLADLAAENPVGDSLSALGLVPREEPCMVTAEAAAHLIRGVALWDPFTGDSLPLALTKVLQSLRVVLGEGGRPLPVDRLQQAAEIIRRPLKEVLATPRSCINRRHVMLPVHRARELDARCIDWLGRQPGRTVREKLARSPRVKAVLRETSIETVENRLVAKLMRAMMPPLQSRVEAFRNGVYSGTPQSSRRLEALEEVLYLCERGLASELFGEIDCSKPVQANNVLLGDRRYSKLWRAWRWVREIEADAQARQRLVSDNAGTALFWSLVAVLAAEAGAKVCDSVTIVDPAWADEPVRVRGGRITPQDFRGRRGDESPEIVICVARGRVSGKGIARRYGTRIRLQDGQISVHTHELTGRVVFRAASQPLAVCTYVAATGELCMSADTEREKGNTVDSAGGMATPMDVGRFAEMAEQIAATVPWREARDEEQNGPVEIPSPDALGTEDLGLDICSVIPRAVAGAESLQLDSRLHAVGYPGERENHAFRWIAGKAQRSCHLLAPQIDSRDIRDAITLYDEEQPELVKQALDCFVESLASDCRSRFKQERLPAVAYTVPDATDEFSQEAVRIAMRKHFPQSSPMWRSAAVALGWQASPAFEKRPLREGDGVIVLDASADALTLTLLKACHDKKLEKALPGSRGIYWERHPSVSEAELPLDAAELASQLASKALMSNYEKTLVALAVKEGHAKSGGLLAAAIKRLSRWGVIEASVGAPQAEIWPISVAGEIGAVGSEFSAKAWAEATRIYGETLEAFLLKVQHAEVINLLRQEAKIGAGKLVMLALGSPFCLSGLPQIISQAAARACPTWTVETAASSQDTAAAGAVEHLRRLSRAVLSYRDYLPHLSLEVIRDGRFHLLELLSPSDAAKLDLQGTTEFAVREKLIIPAGKASVQFPLYIGRRMQRLGQDAVLVDSRLPLEQEEPGRLRLKYTYGADNPYGLAFTPEGGRGGRTTYMRWQKADKPPAPEITFYDPQEWHSEKLQDPTTFLRRKWQKVRNEILPMFAPGVDTTTLMREHAEDFVARWNRSKKNGHYVWALPNSSSRVGEVIAELLRRAFEAPLRLLWDEGRTIAKAPHAIRQLVDDGLFEVLGCFAGLTPRSAALDLRRIDPAARRPVQEKVRWLLARTHVDSPEALATALLADANDAQRLHGVSGIHSALGFVSGDGRGKRADVIDLLGRRALEQINHADEGIYSAIRGLSKALWRHEAVLHVLVNRVPSFVDVALSGIDRVICRIAEEPRSAEYEPLPFSFNLTAANYVAAVQCVLAILRLRRDEAYSSKLFPGAPVLTRLSRAILDADEKIAARRIKLQDTLTLTLQVPSECGKVSPLAYMARACLTGDRGDQLMRIAGVKTSA